MNANLAEAWRKQVAYCDANASPFTARVLDAAWADWQGGGALRDLLPDWAGDAWVDAVPLRVAGALHCLALDGSDPTLASLYPPRRDTFDALAAPAAIGAALRTQHRRVRDYLAVAPQTNEIGRSAVLLGGFARIAIRSGLPLSLLEIGASAGLNQLWHRYRYALGEGRQWGDASSPVLIRSDWRGHVPRLPETIEVADHAACDAAPLDLSTPAAATRLASYVWPDQGERLERLQAAVLLAQRSRVVVERSDALPWVQRQIALPRPGVARVLYHSVMWQYMSPPVRDALRHAIASGGERATPAAPLAWLQFEPGSPGRYELTLTMWPGGQREILATAHAHGREVQWLNDSP